MLFVSAAGLQANYDRGQYKIMSYYSRLVLQCNSTDPDLRVKWLVKIDDRSALLKTATLDSLSAPQLLSFCLFLNVFTVKPR